MAHVAAVLLAAGGSRRLGRPKQLVKLAGKSLVRRAAEAALAAGCAPLFVVLGACADEVAAELAGLDARTVANAGHAEGIASSIRAGIAAAGSATPACDGALLLVVDQPRVDAILLARVLEAFRQGGARDPVACTYAGSVGVPALFPRSLFPELAALRGDRGARSVLEARRDAVREVPFAEGGVDIDTPEDLARLAPR
jgi:molybdenum cofactor cytidylyltransferase